MKVLDITLEELDTLITALGMAQATVELSGKVDTPVARSLSTHFGEHFTNLFTKQYDYNKLNSLGNKLLDLYLAHSLTSSPQSFTD